MIFSSLSFIFRFIPIFFLIYLFIPKNYKNIALLLGSLIFYSWGEAKYFIIIISAIVINYIFSILIEVFKLNVKKKFILMIISITFNIGVLFIFKYLNFFIYNVNLLFGLTLEPVKLSLPLGISFYTFQITAYIIDVYKGKIKTERNIINFGTFVCFFPQLIAGPIIKYNNISKELKNRSINKNMIEEGIELFIIGLGQKVLLANNIGMLWNEINSIGLTELSTILGWIGILAFSLQIYFDFSGYSLMALGLGKSLGFNLPINFNYPYISRSISEFWRRWNITLGNWFKEYLYIPLGGNRKGVIRLIINLFIVWILTGFWHGAEYNFIIWGLYFFVLITLEKIIISDFLKKNKIVSHIYTIFIILIGWVIFSSPNIEYGIKFIKNLFIFNNGLWFYYIRNYGVIILLGILCSTPIVRKTYIKYIKNEFIRSILLIGIFIFSIAYLIDSSYNPFLYFRF